MRKRLILAVSVVGILGTSQLAFAEGLRLESGLQGMVTGALIGSVFGPDKQHRLENAAIGGFAGLLLGSQVAPAQASDRHFDSDDDGGYRSRHSRHSDDSGRSRHHRHRHRHHRERPVIVSNPPSTVFVQPYSSWTTTRTETVVVTPSFGQTTVFTGYPYVSTYSYPFGSSVRVIQGY
ncbi:MAG: hypothetical protein HQL57_05310 [Magnetococcales bacterium]|nr:hypothetical protein [Magnetococcales bacterium]MBF0156583.1 hypothetical protein [Magnetococcales bacterium]